MSEAWAIAEIDRLIVARLAWEEKAEAARALLEECRAALKAAGHTSPRCGYFGECHCGLDNLLARLTAFLEERER